MVMKYIETGGDSDGYWADVPEAPSAQAPAANPPTAGGTTGYKPLADLGYQGQLAQAFQQAGINELPEWMSRYAVGNWNYSDLVNDYQTIHGYNPSNATTGKPNDVLSNMGWSLADNGLHYVGTQPIVSNSSGGEGEGRTTSPGGLAGSYTPADTSTWGAGDQDFFEQSWMRRKQQPNMGAWEDSIKPALMGIGSIASMAAAPYLAGAGAAVEGGLAAAEGAGAAGAGLSLSTEGTMAISDMMLADMAANGIAAGADVGMGAGTSWLTDLGWPASYGFTPTEIANYLAGTTGISGLTSLGDIDWTRLGTNLGQTVLGGGTTGAAQQPIVFNSSSQAPSGGATSPTNATGFNASSPITPATMPTSSIMGAFAPQKEDKNDYMKYFSTLF
jgi:hypothetical protein